jgi:hypothetical protein
MATQAQISANRRNARKSTGPRTTEGKEKASQNALRHGLRARQAVIPGEDPGEFEAYRKQMLAELAPAGAVESMLAERVVHLSWRLRRAERVQNAVFDTLYASQVGYEPYRRCSPASGSSAAANPDGDWALGHTIIADFADCKILDRLLVYERRIEQSLYKAMHELERLQLQRQANPPAEKPAAQSQSCSKPAMLQSDAPAEPQPATETKPPEPEARSTDSERLLRQTKPIDAGETPSIADCRLRVGDSRPGASETSKRQPANEANLVEPEGEMTNEANSVEAGTGAESVGTAAR